MVGLECLYRDGFEDDDDSGDDFDYEVAAKDIDSGGSELESPDAELFSFAKKGDMESDEGSPRRSSRDRHPTARALAAQIKGPIPPKTAGKKKKAIATAKKGGKSKVAKEPSPPKTATKKTAPATPKIGGKAKAAKTAPPPPPAPPPPVKAAAKKAPAVTKKGGKAKAPRMTSPPKATNKKAAPAASSKSGQARAAQADPPRPPTPPLPSKSTAKWKHAKQAPPKAQKRDKKGGPVRGVVEDEQQEEVVVNVSGDDDDEEEETDRARRDEIRRGKRPAVDEPYEPQGRKKRPRLEVRFKLPGDDELGDDDSVNYEDENRDEEEDEEEDDDEYEDADNVILPVFEYNRLLSAALTSEFGCWPGGRIELTPEEAQKRAESTSGKIAKEMEFWHKWSRDTNKASAKLGKALSPKDKHGLFVPLDQPYRYSVDDQEIRDLWLRLQTKVSDLVAKYFPNLDYLMDRGENPEVEEVMRILMSSSVDFSGDPLDREEALIMVEGYIWHNLRRMIFDERSGAWAGNYQRGQIHSWFNNTLMHAGDERWPELESHLHEMRARMETIMGQLNFDLHQASDSHAAIFAGPIARLVPEELADTYLEESLQIVNWAADFDRKFRRSRADWKLLPSDGLRYWPQDGQTFDSTVMEDCQDPADVEDNRPIFMFVAPGLVKRGNDEGTNYGEEEVIAKTRVWVGYQDDSSVED